MKKILVTGSNGLLGQKVVELLVHRRNSEVIAASYSDNMIRTQEGYSFEFLDITNEAETAYIFDKYKPDVVIHTAALTEVARCEERKDEAWKVNVDGTVNVINGANKAGAHVIYLSSDFVFDGLNGPYREEDPVNPVNHYGLTKLEGEKAVMKMARQWSILRTCLVYGVNQHMARPNFLLWVKHSLEEGERIRVNNDQWRTPTLADDLAFTCIQIAEKGQAGLYHVSGSEYLSVLNFAYRIAAHFGLDKEYITPVASGLLHENGKRPMKTGFHTDKAVKDLLFHPHTLDESIKRVEEQIKEMETLDD